MNYSNLEIMSKTIFIDLDETLVSSVDVTYGESNVDDNFPTYTLNIPEYNVNYVSHLRPHSLEFLKSIRTNFKNVYLLTAATRVYTEMISDHFGLGFDYSDIICRDDYLYGSEEYRGKFVHHGMNILIDNENTQDTNLQQKMKFLGEDSHHIHIHAFNISYDIPRTDLFHRDGFSKVLKEIYNIYD